MSAAASLAVLLAACGGDGDDAADTDQEASGEEAFEAEEAQQDEPDEEPDEGPDEPGGEPEQSYEVQAGDTLSGIAEEFDVTVEDLIEANDLDDPDVLIEGDELVIP